MVSVSKLYKVVFLYLPFSQSNEHYYQKRKAGLRISVRKFLLLLNEILLSVRKELSVSLVVTAPHLNNEDPFDQDQNNASGYQKIANL